jgi:hypothetical protein
MAAFDPLRTFGSIFFTHLKQAQVQTRQIFDGIEPRPPVTRNWDHYLCALGDDLASIYLDLGQAKVAPVPSHQHSTMVSVTMLRAQENGMSSDDEFDDLVALEDDLEAQAHAIGAVYVGRLTTRGRRIFYLYSPTPSNVGAAVMEVMERHRPYVLEVTDRADPEWSTYFDFLYPGEADYHHMMNRRLN